MGTPKREMRICMHHGVHEHVWEASSGFFKCVACRSDNVRKRRLKLKQMAVAYKGGKCQRCGYDKSIWALEFHHREGKDFGVANSTWAWARIKAEADKCDLLCANCHREEHAANPIVQYTCS